MSRLNDVIEESVRMQDAPFLVAMVEDRDGVKWSGAAGDRAPGQKATTDTVFRIFSMTKAIGCTAAMILMDRGKLDPNAPVESIIPEFKEIKVLDGFDGDAPRLRSPRTKATVRNLATHTSGFVYEFWNADIPKYMQATGHPSILSGLKSSLNYPLTFDPGERWDYGIGVDWLGQVVEAVDGRRIERFCREEIFDPLNMNDTGFEVEDSMAGRLASVSMRGEDGKFGGFDIAPPSRPEFYGMGHALYSTAPDYMRFLRMYLNKGELQGKRLLSENTVDSLLSNQIGDIEIPVFKTQNPAVSADVDLFPGLKKSHSMAFMRVDEDVPGRRAAGSQFWAGVLNTHCWFDPKRNVAAVLMTQSLPFGEPRFMRAYDAFEQAVYAQ
ncbi:MAG TPA: serine hydrolase domain-containing protein [Roseiarcus sp.]|nr:serine hydrolase domain-containing protein [Roseiarcus sp.]